MSESERDIGLFDFLDILWRRRWFIVIPAAVLAVLAGIVSFLLPPRWDVDAVIQPSKYVVLAEPGIFTEVVVVEPLLLAAQISQGAYNGLIGTALNLDPRTFPRLRAESPRDTKLVRVTVRTGEPEKAKAILASLFQQVKTELDRKIEIGLKILATQIASKENAILSKELDIQIRNIEIDKSRQAAVTLRNKLKISEERVRNLIEEKKGVKARIEELDKRQAAAAAEKPGGIETLGLLLYVTEIQRGLQYANTLDESLNAARNAEEDLRLSIFEKDQAIKGAKAEIEKVGREIAGLRGESDILNEKKQAAEYARLVQEPRVSLSPVWPKKKQNILLAGFIGLFLFAAGALLVDYFLSRKTALNRGA